MQVPATRVRWGRSRSGGASSSRVPGAEMTLARTRHARPRMPRHAVRLLAAALALLALAGGGWLWLRGSSLAAVRQVTILGVRGPQAGKIRAALQTAARTMTTLDVKPGVLHTAVSAYPVVKALHVSTQFPHRMRIDVVEQIPVAVIGAGGGQTEVSADGTLLRGVPAAIHLPTISTDVAPGGTRVTGTALGDIRLLAAAPVALLSRVAQASSDRSHGLVAKLRDGPWVYFGAADDLHAKWAAAGAVLADTSTQGAGYIDVTVAARPAAGSGADAASRPAAGGGSPASAGSATTGN